MRLWSLVSSLVLLSLVSGCANPEYSFSTNLLPEHTTVTPSKENPRYDSDGNLIVSPEIKTTYHMPDIHAGLAADWEAQRLRPVFDIELFEFKMPYLRTNAVGLMAGEDLVGMHLSHQWTSIYEIQTGVFYGYDTDIKKPTFGLTILLMKF